ncbi:Longin domain,Longin-like domain,Synaptobrevin [Cinara cedri]|uniref:Longin domain,Longin-like domain,Synaptobrevin n=1 Tax=Cinara cedri TaxID=506608 RepID=A0A5E4M8A2_9HEMI|nr:Longin domain,Longin-like domain,Synaptobrevin [Cinara cedri]
MVLLTMISRIPDGLPLVASLQDDKQIERKLIEYRNQANFLCKKLNSKSPKQCTIDSPPYYFHYLIERDVCYLVLCERNFSKLSAFSFLEHIADVFNRLYGRQVSIASRPYTLIEFDNYIQKAKKNYIDSRVRKNLNKLNNERQYLQSIVVHNIDDVLQRNAILSELDSKTQNVSTPSVNYTNKSTSLIKKSMFVKLTGAAICFTTLFLYFTFSNVIH